MAGRRYFVDTNLYIDALRNERDRLALGAFLATYSPFIYLSAVVVQELRAGVRGRAAVRLEAAIVAPFERRDRLVTPSCAAWKETGRVLSELVGPKAWPAVTRSFVNDVLLAMSCREAGVVLVTRNVVDCARIASARPFEFVGPWPFPRM